MGKRNYKKSDYGTNWFLGSDGNYYKEDKDSNLGDSWILGADNKLHNVETPSKKSNKRSDRVKNKKLKKFKKKKEKINLPKRNLNSFMVQKQKSVKNEESNVKWFEEKQKNFETIQFYISNFLQDNFENISNKQPITFDMWVKYVNKNPSIDLNSQELSEITFEKYRKLWFLSKFQTTYRKYYEIPYKVQKYSDLKGQYYEDFKNFLNIFLNKLKLKSPEKIKEEIIYHYNNIIQNIKYQDLPKRSRNPKYFASAMLFYNINSFMNMSQTDFTLKLNSNNNVKIYLSYLSILIKFLYKIYFNKLNISDYKPSIPDKIIDKNIYYNQLFEYVSEGIKILKLPFKDINKKCIDLYNQAIKNGFNITIFPIKHPKYLATTLLFLSNLSNNKIENYNQSNIINRLNDFNLNPTKFSNTIHLFQNYLDEQIIVPFQNINYNRELFEKKIKKIIDENPEYLEGILILKIFQLSNLDPISFVKNLKIYNIKKEKLKPSFLLNILKKNTEFVQRKKFNEIIKRFKNFIETSIPKDLKQKADDILNEYIQKRLLKKFDSLRRARQKKKLTESLYGENFRSIEKRFNNFCNMRGFSPFDGTDLIELLEKEETLGYHHMDYNAKNDDTFNLCFLPKRSIEGRTYISHNMISGLQANLEHYKDRPDTEKKLQIKLDELYKMGINNSKLIRKVVKNKKIDELDKLENWSKESISLLINRIFEDDFESRVWKYKTNLSAWEHRYKDYEDFY